MADDGAFYAAGQQLPGTVYRVVRHLATGGMGSVYDVEDVTVGKRYVLKTLHPQLVARDDLARRMEAEARTLAKLQHPNIVDVVTAGVTGDAMRMPFYVMERLNGQNLRVLLEKRGVIELVHAFRIAIDVLDALEQAHDNNVIHRDVKPENIFLHRQINGTTITKLLDFGIMRLLDRKKSHTAGKFIGTLRYASPEQISGGDLGPATDIYSLGLVLYEMIAGRGPFDDVREAYAVGLAHASTPPPPLSTFTRVAPRVEQLVMSSIAKDPALRPRDAFTFAGELRRMLREEEAAPKSVTAVNVLTSAPETRRPDPGLLGTVPVAEADPTATAVQKPSAAPAAPPRSPLAMTNATAEGMIAPTVPPSVVPAAYAGGAARFGAPVVSAAAISPTEIAPRHAVTPVGIDRSAATHTSAPFGHTLPLARNGTAIDGFEAPLEAVQAAVDQRAPLEVPPVDGRPSVPPPSELVFPPSPGPLRTATGMAAEARTRPPERPLVVVPLIALAIGLLGGGAYLAKDRLVKAAPSAAAGASSPELPADPAALPRAAATPETVPAPPPPPPPPQLAASASAATSAGASAAPPAPPGAPAPGPSAAPKPAARGPSSAPAPRPARPASPGGPARPRSPGMDD